MDSSSPLPNLSQIAPFSLEVLVAWRFRPGPSEIDVLAVGFGLSVCHCFEIVGRAASLDVARSSQGEGGLRISAESEGQLTSLAAESVVMMYVGVSKVEKQTQHHRNKREE